MSEELGDADTLPGKMQFKGAFAAQLEEFANLLARLWVEHRTSPTRAGNESFYAWGTLDYVVVMSGRGLDDLVELKTRLGNLEIFRDEDGFIDCRLSTAEERDGHRSGLGVPRQVRKAEPAEILEAAHTALRKYYYER